MATFKQYTKKDGTTAWQYQTYLGVDEKTGKRKATTHRGFKSKKEAQIHLNLYLADYERGELEKSPKMTFQELYTLYLESYQLQVKTSTLANTKRGFRTQILPVLSERYIEKITVSDCQKIVNSWNEKYKAVKYYRSLVRKVFNFAVRMELLENNPMEKTILPRKKVVEKVDNFYDRQQLKEFFVCVDDYVRTHNRVDMKCLVFFRLLAFTGMRKSEVLALKWSDFRLLTSEISVSKTLAMGENYEILVQTPKTSSSYRTIKLDDETVSILKKWRAEQMKTYFLLGFNLNSPDNLIFSTYKNTPMFPTQPSRWLEKILKQYQLPKITLHGFRHTHATLLLEGGASIKEVQERLGHGSAVTTMEIYAHLTTEKADKTAENFARYVNL
ncbi:MAG: site-specific integrase [Streptococcaceae bacterium]|jgi:integrase|nr:site-specific integrase [Streptococcaceae bacterium]